MEPLPNEFVIDAWKARVGYSFDNERTQDAYSLSALILCTVVLPFEA